MFKRILVPLDGSKLAEKALPYAEALAQKFEAELILVRVLQLLPEVIPAGPFGGMVFHEQTVQERREATAYLNQMTAQVRKVGPLPLRTVVLDTPSVADAITKLACDESVDLIVMSTHGRSGLSRLVHGSVAGKVLEHAPCPVFLVKANESDCESNS
jgi:nucleotide-binding universal stress UspA family protein